MTLVSSIIGLLATIMPILISALDRRLKATKPPERKLINTVSLLDKTDDEQEVENAWATHDAQLEQLL